MPKRATATQDGPTLLDLLEEQERGPLPCPHMNAWEWRHDRDPDSPYYEEWVHVDPNCQRSRHPGRRKQPVRTSYAS